MVCFRMDTSAEIEDFEEDIAYNVHGLRRRVRSAAIAPGPAAAAATAAVETVCRGSQWIDGMVQRRSWRRGDDDDGEGHDTDTAAPHTSFSAAAGPTGENVEGKSAGVASRGVKRPPPALGGVSSGEEEEGDVADLGELLQRKKARRAADASDRMQQKSEQ